MHDHRSSAWNSSLNTPSPPRVAVVGGGIGGLACARELRLRGCDPVVFEAEDRLGGRCSSRSTRVGLFDDGAQCISGASRLAIHVAQPPGELAALHPWTVAATPTEEERNSKAWKQDEDEADVTRTLKLTGSVGVPSMAALADALARPLHIRLNTPIVQARRRAASWALSSAVGEIEEDFQALVLAMPAPLAVPLARESSELTAALRAVRYRSRWVLLLGTERPVPLPGYREFQGSPIERVAAKLEGKHWMFKGQAQRLDIIKMCDDCRVTAVTEQDFDPYAAPPRPAPRTTDDYLREREAKGES